MSKVSLNKWSLLFFVSNDFPSLETSAVSAWSALFAEHSVAVEFTFSKFPEQVVVCSAITSIAVDLHFIAEVVNAAWHFNCTNSSSISLNNDIWSMRAKWLASVCKSIFLEGNVCLAVELDGVLSSSLLSWNAGSADTFTIFGNSADLVTVLLDEVSVVFLKTWEHATRFTMAVGKWNFLL